MTRPLRKYLFLRLPLPCELLEYLALGRACRVAGARGTAEEGARTRGNRNNQAAPRGERGEARHPQAVCLHKVPEVTIVSLRLIFTTLSSLSPLGKV